MKRNPLRDPIASFEREARAARQVGQGNRCSQCGEGRPLALIRGSNPTICANCQREEVGKSPFDDHHPAGRANHPLTVPVAVNDHRCLTDAQYDWPSNTYENRKRSPLLAGAACIRGYYETNSYLTDRLLFWVVRLLETLNETLLERLGPDWWVGTKLEEFMPKPKPNR
jgi:ribosomal protein S14